MIPIHREALNPIKDKFDFVQELPNGFLGPTFVVKNIISKEMLVCKICHKAFLGKEEFINNFRKRIKYLLQLSLPFIVSYTDIIEDENDFFLFRPYIHFLSLTDYINTAQNSSPNIRPIFQNIISAVREVHNRKIYRIPIHPTNIFLTSNNSVILTDLYELNSDVSWALITPNPIHLAFLAPEFFDGKSTPSDSSDIWSLGVVLSFMRSKTLPWPTKNICAMIKKITHVEYTLPSVPRNNCDIDYIISKCLVSDAESRPTIDELINLKMPKQRRPNSLPIPRQISNSPSHQMLTRDAKMKFPFLSYSVLESQKKLTRQLSSGSVKMSTYKIRCRFVSRNANSDC